MSNDLYQIRQLAVDSAIRSLTETHVTQEGSRTFVHTNGENLLKRARLIVNFVLNGTIPEGDY